MRKNKKLLGVFLIVVVLILTSSTLVMINKWEKESRLNNRLTVVYWFKWEIKCLLTNILGDKAQPQNPENSVLIEQAQGTQQDFLMPVYRYKLDKSVDYITSSDFNGDGEGDILFASYKQSPGFGMVDGKTGKISWQYSTEFGIDKTDFFIDDNGNCTIAVTEYENKWHVGKVYLLDGKTGKIKKTLYTDGPSHGICFLGEEDNRQMVIGTCYGYIHQYDYKFDEIKRFRDNPAEWYSIDVIKKVNSENNQKEFIEGIWAKGRTLVRLYNDKLEKIWENQIVSRFKDETGPMPHDIDVAEYNNKEIAVVSTVPYSTDKDIYNEVTIFDLKEGTAMLQFKLPDENYSSRGVKVLEYKNGKVILVLGSNVRGQKEKCDKLYFYDLDGKLFGEQDLWNNSDDDYNPRCVSISTGDGKNGNMNVYISASNYIYVYRLNN